jgi:hypothetical protein
LEAAGEESMLELGPELDRCGADVGCRADRLRRANVRYGLALSLKLDGQRQAATATLIDSVAGREAAHGLVELEVKTALAAVRTLIRSLLDKASIPSGGRVILELDPPDALVLAPSEPSSSGVLRVPPGGWSIRAEREGYRPSSVEAEVRAFEDTHLTIALEKEPALWGQWWFWAGVGTAGALGAVALALILRPAPSSICVHQGGAPCPPL